MEELVGILVVCRANVFRSPIAAAMLSGRLRTLGVLADVRSVGLAIDPRSSGADLAPSVREWGVDLSGHQVRQLDPSDTSCADLVLTMEHHQVADVVALDPDAWPRTFTLKEIVRRADEKAPRAGGESFAAWVGRVHAGRTRLGLVGAWHDDVADPAGLPPSELDRTIAELDALVDRFANSAWPRAWRRR